jgi:hypothetical protein
VTTDSGATAGLAFAGGGGGSADNEVDESRGEPGGGGATAGVELMFAGTGVSGAIAAETGDAAGGAAGIVLEASALLKPASALSALANKFSQSLEPPGCTANGLLAKSFFAIAGAGVEVGVTGRTGTGAGFAGSAAGDGVACDDGAIATGFGGGGGVDFAPAAHAGGGRAASEVDEARGEPGGGGGRAPKDVDEVRGEPGGGGGLTAGVVACPLCGVPAAGTVDVGAGPVVAAEEGVPSAGCTPAVPPGVPVPSGPTVLLYCCVSPLTSVLFCAMTFWTTFSSTLTSELPKSCALKSPSCGLAYFSPAGSFCCSSSLRSSLSSL